MTKLLIIMLCIGIILLLVSSILFLASMYKDYNEAEKAHKKLMDENNYYL